MQVNGVRVSLWALEGRLPSIVQRGRPRGREIDWDEVAVRDADWFRDINRCWDDEREGGSQKS